MAEGINQGLFKFTDRNGIEWDLTITLNEAWRVDKADFSGVSDEEVSFTVPTEDMLPNIISESQLLFAVMWYIIEPQAEARGMNYEQFCGSIDGSCIWNAHLAFMEALQGFFPDARIVLSPMVKVMRKTLAKSKEGEVDQMNEVTAVIEKAMEKMRLEGEEKRAVAKKKASKLDLLGTPST